MSGHATQRRVDRLAELIREADSVVALTGAGDLGALGDPRLPLARAPGCGRRSTRWRSRTSTSSGATRSASGTSTATASRRSAAKQPNAAHAALVELERRGRARRRRSPRTSTSSTAGPARASSSRSTARSPPRHALVCRGPTTLEEARAAGAAAADGVPRCDCGEPLKPDVVLFGEMLAERTRCSARSTLAGGRRPAALRRLLARGLPGRRAARADARRGRARSRSSPRARRPTTAPPRCGSTATSWQELEALLDALDAA